MQDIDPDLAEWDFRDFPLDEVAELFNDRGWPLFDTTDVSDQTIDRLVWQVAAALLAEPEALALRYGRLLAYRSNDNPTCIEIAMDIGHLDFEAELRKRGRMNDDD